MTSISYLKGGMLLIYILTSVVLFITTYHLFWGSKPKETRAWRSVTNIDGWISSNLKGPGSKSKKSLQDNNTTLSEQERLWSNFLEGCANSSSVGRKRSLHRYCNDRLCTDYLSESDLKAFIQCEGNSTRRFKRFLGYQNNSDLSRRLEHCLKQASSSGVLATGTCRFMSGEGRGVVGLISFPGSGNTWVRGLLQSATGICTGAVFCDASLRLGGFDGEGIQTSSVLVVKSHASIPAWSWQEKQSAKKNRVLFDSVILLIRNPFHALVSEWNRLLSTKFNQHKRTSLSHVQNHGQEYFLHNTDWSEFVQKQISRWRKTFDWLISGAGGGRSGQDVLVVRYEDVVLGVELQVKRMLDFLHFNITDAELSKRLGESVQLFRRPKGAEFDHFTLEQKTLINSNIQTLGKVLQATFGWTFHTDQYMQTDL